eukprot:11232848-Alexandrium_andersonii.AAC.1
MSCGKGPPVPCAEAAGEAALLPTVPQHRCTTPRPLTSAMVNRVMVLGRIALALLCLSKA